LNDCQLAQFDPEFSFSAGDLNHDCIVDFYDLRQLVDNWQLFIDDDNRLLGKCFFDASLCGYADIYAKQDECQDECYSYLLPEPNDPNTLTLGLVSLWKFNESCGNIAYDSFGNNNGTIHGATRVKGMCGNALSFDGVDDYVEMQPFGLSNVSILVWIKIPNDGGQGPIFWRQTNSNNPIYGMYYNGALTAVIRNGSIGDYWSQKDVWTHVAMTYDGNSVKIYKNGEFTKSGTIIADINDNSGQTYIGRGYVYYYWWYYWQGQIDEVAVYNKALTQQEIQSQIYRGERNGIVDFEDFAVLAEEWLKKSD
jgi:hypothetical protein